MIKYLTKWGGGASQKGKINTENNAKNVAVKKVRKLNYKNELASKKGLNKLPVFVLLFFAMLLYASILFFVMPPQNIQTTPQNKMAVSALGSGSCGTNVTYSFDSTTGTLTISGSGAMTDYEYSNNSPFYNQTEIKSIVITGGITHIGDYEFRGCSGLTSITISDSVTSIGYQAFQDCSKLTSVTLSNSVTSIGGYTFQGCSALTSITIPDSVTKIGNYAFEDCSGLTSITIPSNVTSIGDGAFEGCSGLTSFTIPAGVTSIGVNTFYGTGYYNAANNWTGSLLYIGNWLINAKRKDIQGSCVIDSKTTNIAGGVFSGCYDLTSVTIPNSVRSIGEKVFYNCHGLTSITIPDNVTSIEEETFAGCSGLSSIILPAGITSIGDGAFWWCKSLTSFTIPIGVTRISYQAFRECSALKSITIHNSVTSIGDSAFGGCDALTSIVVDSNNDKYDSRGNCNAIIESSTNTLIAGCKNTIIPNSVIGIGNYAFSYFSGLTSIEIPNSVTSIGPSAFQGCSALTSITIPDSVTKIGNAAFYYCSGLTSVTIPNSVTKIGYQTFYECSALTSITIPTGVTSIETRAFYNCSALTSIIIPDSVTSFGDNVFYNCSNLTIISSGDTKKTAYTYAQSNSIDYATAWVKKDSSTHMRTFYGFRTNSSATAETQTESHNFGTDNICSDCGALNLLTIMLNVTTNVSRDFVIYILDSSNQPIRQFVVTNGDEINFTIVGSAAFTIQVYETLYMSATIGGTKTLKRTYTNLTSDTIIVIDISGVTNVNNWVMI